MVEPVRAANRVLVLGSHPAHGHSMLRYTRILTRAYSDAGFDVAVIRPTDILSRSVRLKPLKKLLVYVEQLILFPAALWFRRDGAIWHVADHSDALWLVLRPRAAVIVTCHDLIAVRAALGEIPQHRTRWSGRFYQSLVRAGLRRASMIMSVSETTAQDVSRLVVGSRVRVLTNPLDPDFVGAAEAGRREDGADSLVFADGLPYVVLVSSSGWRKRREHALAVWARLRASAPDIDLRIVVVGPPLTERELRDLPPRSQDIIDTRTAMPDGALAACYEGALAVLQVSLMEGFGWPIIEANSQRTPALCADTQVFREVAGPSALFIAEDLTTVDWDNAASWITSGDARDAAAANAARFSFPGFVEQLATLATQVREGEGRE